MRKFWMVWREGTCQVTHKHETELSARKEAERLSRMNPGEIFYVLESLDYCMKYDVFWASLLDKNGDIPF